MARNTDDPANPERIRNDVDCRAARPKFEDGVWTASKISDATGGGLYLLITLDPNRPGRAGSKLWRMAYRFRGRQKTYSIGLYGNGNDGIVSLATARQKRDAAKALLAQDPPVDPSIEKQFDRHRRVAECESARGPDADRHVKLLIQFAVEGACFGADLQIFQRELKFCRCQPKIRITLRECFPSTGDKGSESAAKAC